MLKEEMRLSGGQLINARSDRREDERNLEYAFRAKLADRWVRFPLPDTRKVRSEELRVES